MCNFFLILNKKKNLHFWSKAKFLSTGVVQHQTIDEKIYIARIFHPPVWPHCAPEGGKQIQRVNDGWGQGHSQLVYSARGANRFKFVLEIRTIIAIFR